MEIKAIAALDFLVLQPVKEQVITGIASGPVDFNSFRNFLVLQAISSSPATAVEHSQEFHTTIGNIISANELADGSGKTGAEASSGKGGSTGIDAEREIQGTAG